MTRWTAIAVLAALVATAPLPGPAEAQTSDAVGVVTTLDGRATVDQFLCDRTLAHRNDIPVSAWDDGDESPIC